MRAASSDSADGTTDVSKLWVGVLAFAGGVAVGLYVAKLYATATITSDVNGLLGKIGLGGGAVQSFVDQSVIPIVVN